MILVYRDEISTLPAGTGFNLQLPVEIEFRPGKAGQFSTWHLLRFLCIFELFTEAVQCFLK